MADENSKSCNPALSAVFLQHAAWLTRWAKHFAHGLPVEPSDLMHDLYLRLRESETLASISQEDQIRAFLYRSLRNLAATERRKARLTSQCSISFEDAEYLLPDSIAQGAQRYPFRDRILTIVDYAVARRDNYRWASVLLFRFFLDLSVPDIMVLLGAKRSAIDSLIESGRLEMRRLEEGRLSRKGTHVRSQRRTTDTTFDGEVFGRIFVPPPSPCPSEEAWIHRYHQRDRLRLSTPEAAHLSSCQRCLLVAAQCNGIALPFLKHL